VENRVMNAVRRIFKKGTKLSGTYSKSDTQLDAATPLAWIVPDTVKGAYLPRRWMGTTLETLAASLNSSPAFTSEARTILLFAKRKWRGEISSGFADPSEKI